MRALVFGVPPEPVAVADALAQSPVALREVPDPVLLHDDWVITRPKRGFTPPVHEWHKAIFAAHGDTLKDGFLVTRRILKPESGCALAKGTFPGGAGTPLSYKALTLELWCRSLAAGLHAEPNAMNRRARGNEPIPI